MLDDLDFRLCFRSLKGSAFMFVGFSSFKLVLQRPRIFLRLAGAAAPQPVIVVMGRSVMFLRSNYVSTRRRHNMAEPPLPLPSPGPLPYLLSPLPSPPQRNLEASRALHDSVVNYRTLQACMDRLDSEPEPRKATTMHSKPATVNSQFLFLPSGEELAHQPHSQGS